MSSTESTGAAPLSVAIVGAGQVARHHIGAFSRLQPSVRIVGVADIDERRAVELAATCGAPAFTDYRTLLALSPDIAVICLPHHLHREAGLLAAAAGSHILMEKPLANTLEDAHAIVDACRRHSVLLTTSFVHRYRVQLQLAHQLISAGQIGTPAVATDHWGIPGGTHVPPWVWNKREGGGGILMYSGIHSIDWLRWLVGSEVEEVFARSVTHSQAAEVEDGLVVTLVFANGCLGSLVGNQPAYEVTPRSRDIEIYGSRARIRFRPGEYLDYTSDAHAYRVEATRDDHFLSQAREFVAAVRAKRTPWITGEDGVRALETVLAIYRSTESRRPVALADIR